MAVKIASRVAETTTTSGTGTIDLDGAKTGFQAFSDGFSTGDVVYYVIEDGDDMEEGYGTLTSGTPDTLTRNTVLLSIEAGVVGTSKITLSGSAATVFATAPGSKLMVADENGTFFINDTLNANMTIGLTINQGANDDQALALKSSDVTTGLTTITDVNVEIDDYLVASKFSGTLGGAHLQAMGEDAALETVFGLTAYGGTANTSKDETARGVFHLYASAHNGANVLANIAAQGNVFVVERRVGGANRAAFIVDAEGDLFADAGVATTDMVTLFDGEEDVALCRAFDLVRAEKGRAESQLIRTEWDDWARRYKPRLAELNVLGADGPNGERGLVNVTQLQRLHNGAICQLHTALMETQKRLALTERRLAMLPDNAG